MKTSIFASAVVLSLAALTGVASANGIVPGSDTYERAADGVAVNSVIRGETVAPRASVVESRSFGYPATEGAAVNVVPGSRYETRAIDSNAVNSVIRGDYHAGYTASPVEQVRVVPGSDSFGVDAR
ncbi:hypothetical protein [Aureimonas phyllosphaerae]|uniref:Uncharacterized protein n=1 Tax=Aureimonas phyllosphaerae TaxID=1166078 RepID=A0A7W6BZW7_9HYPH|nr:hypothetical protein [Aureimonas phyllosphaerae]MBB3935832.1 hypothetical protein [Aureimonas phyllosphaerae]MBB3959840.1 hypothetical protein [Aureimonas phyllosphaerae]SFF15658.1 hypothetical protein SAMN05216566_103372 [Aureimonas phyllosphaerae]